MVFVSVFFTPSTLPTKAIRLASVNLNLVSIVSTIFVGVTEYKSPILEARDLKMFASCVLSPVVKAYWLLPEAFVAM